MYGQFPQPLVNKGSIRIEKMFLQETGTYNQMVYRPFETHVDGQALNNFLNSTSQLGSKGITIFPEVAAGTASALIKPSTTPQGVVGIPLGWNERRYQFVLYVDVTMRTGMVIKYYVQGYTNYCGVTPNGIIDPNMELIVNSVFQISRATMQTAYGQEALDVITNVSHIVSSNNHSVDMNNRSMNTSDFMKMRPLDLINGVQSSHLSDTINSIYGGHRYQTVVDNRFILEGNPTASKRNHSIPTNYMTNLFNSYNQAVNLADFGMDSQNIYQRAVQLSYADEAQLDKNYFLYEMANICGRPTTDRFTFSQLASLDPNLKNVTHLMSLGSQGLSRKHQVGQTANWNSVDNETIQATMLANTIPSLMMEFGLTGLDFAMTNNVIGGMPIMHINNVESISTGSSVKNVELFKVRVLNEVMKDISMNNMIMYNISMRVSVFGECWISISLNGQAAVDYSTPTFADALYTPVISTNKDLFRHNVACVEQIFNQIQEASAPATSKLQFSQGI
jgi:hypothetical protein